MEKPLITVAIILHKNVGKVTLANRNIHWPGLAVSDSSSDLTAVVLHVCCCLLWSCLPDNKWKYFGERPIPCCSLLNRS